MSNIFTMTYFICKFSIYVKAQLQECLCYEFVFVLSLLNYYHFQIANVRPLDVMEVVM